MTIPALLLALAVSSRAQVPFEAASEAIVRGAVPTADELAAAIRGGSREERMAAIARASGMLGGFDSMGQRLILHALREQAESPSAPGEVRGRAFVVLGEQVGWLKDDAAKRDAAGVLLDALEATSGDSREGFRRHALKGLWAAAGRLPRDEALENRTANALIACASSADGVERTFALLGLDGLLRDRPRVASTHRAGMALQSSILEPIARDPVSFCTDGRRNDDERWAALKVLIALAWAGDDSSVRERVRSVMSSVASADSNPTLRRLADRWARSIRA